MTQSGPCGLAAPRLRRLLAEVAREGVADRVEVAVVRSPLARPIRLRAAGSSSTKGLCERVDGSRRAPARSRSSTSTETLRVGGVLAESAEQSMT
jgi:hypothetical protein